jgi:hypothetical protein
MHRFFMNIIVAGSYQFRCFLPVCRDHVVVESTLQHGRELAASELGNVRLGVVEVPVAEIIQSEPGGVESTDSECMDISGGHSDPGKAV